MADINSLKKEIAGMGALALSMWRSTHRTFIEHDVDLIPPILDDENKLNDLEKKMTAAIVEAGKSVSKAEEKARLLNYADIVQDLELIGDYCKDVLERVQIKIEEKLMFSDESFEEYESLYRKSEEALNEVVCALERGNPAMLKAVLKSEEHIDILVDKIRSSHNERMLAGICTPISCNMYLNMLDFTAAVYYHTKKIAKSLLKIKG